MMRRVANWTLPAVTLGIALLHWTPSTRSQTPDVPGSQDATPTGSDRLDEALDLLSGGFFARGLELLAEVLADTGEPFEQSHLRYLAARAEQEAGRCQAAVTRYLALETAAQADDPWVGRARFGRAECLLEMGESDTALELFAAEAEALLAPERLEELAETLIGYAREAARPTSTGSVAEPALARGLYQLVLDLEPGGVLQDESEHFIAAGVPPGQGGDPDRLLMRLRRNPDGPWACADRLALAQLTDDLPVYWHVIRTCDAEQAVPAALELNAGYEGQIGIQALELVLTRFPENGRARELKAGLALAQIERDDPGRGRELLLAVLDQPEGFDLDLALSAADRLALRDRGDQARELWDLVREHTTRPADFEIVRFRWVEQRLREVSQAQSRQDLDLALEILDSLADEVPTELARVRTLRGQLLAQASRWADAEAELRAARTPEAIGFLVEMLESLGRLEDAAPLRQQLGLQGRSELLEVAVVRPFALTEEPYLLARTDALSELELRFRRIDVQDHLRSMGTLTGLEALDIDLIAPEVTRRITLEAPILDGEQQPGPTNGPISLGPMAPGVYALQVVGQRRQATAILVISDISLVARNVGGDLVVLVVDRIAQTPVNRARILVTDGSRVLAEGQTDASGIFRAEAQTGMVEVLAVREDDVAFLSVPSPGGATAVGLREQLAQQRRVQLWLDRDLAIPGERIAYLAIVSEGESPRRLTDRPILVQLFSGPQLIDQWESGMVGGLVRGTVDLPSTLPTGRYELAIEQERRAFVVGQEGTHRPQLRVTQEAVARAPGPAYFLVEWTAADDLPAAGMEVHGDLQDGLGRRSLGTTDENGRLRLTVPLIPGVPTPMIEVEDMVYPVELADAPAEVSCTLPVLSTDTSAQVDLSWTGGQDAQGWMTIFRTATTHRLPSPPAITPGWWPVLSVDSRPQLVQGIRFQLQEGQGRIPLPPLEAGGYRIEVELFRSDGHHASWSRQVEVFPAADSLDIQTPDQSRTPNGTLALEYQQDLRLLPRSPSPLPMLLTIEGLGVAASAMVRSGQETTLSLPEGLVGEGRLVLTRFDETGPTESRQQPLHLEVPISVERRIDLAADVSDGPDRLLEVSLTDRSGRPVRTPVFVALLPAEWEVDQSIGALFPITSNALPATSGWSRVESFEVASTAVDQEILEMQAELAYRSMPAQVIEFDEWSEEGLGGLYGLGGEGAGHGGGGVGYGRAQARVPQVQLGRSVQYSSEQDISPRHLPALWTLSATDGSGRLLVPIPGDLVDRGWYHLTVVSLEGLGGEPSGGELTGHTGTKLVRSLWLDEPLWIPPRAMEPVWAATREYRRMLGAGETATLEASGARWLVVEVSGPSPDEVVSVLLAPDLAFGSQPAYWSEQVETMDFARSSAEQAEHGSQPDQEAGMLRWIAGRRSSTVQGRRPLSAQEVSAILLEIERLAEDETASRAEALLGLGRRSPGHSQGIAALMRLARSEGAHDPDVVGTLALAMLLLDPGDPQAARALVPELTEAAQSASLLGRARAIEALVRLGQTPPVDPRQILEDVPARPEERSAQDTPLALGSLARALLADGGSSPTAPPVVEIRSGSLDIEMPPGRYLFPCAEGDGGLELTATGAPVAIRVSLVSPETRQTAGFSLHRTALRHGPWFLGEEIIPPGQQEVAPAAHGVAGRRMRVRLQLTGPWRDETREVEIEEVLPPGGRLVSGSVEGADLVWAADGRVVFHGRLRTNLVVSYLVDLIQPTEWTAGYPVPAVLPDWPAALARGTDGTVLAISPAGALRVNDRSEELARRLSGEVIWPAEEGALTTGENLALGLAIQRASGASNAQQQLAFDLLLPLLEGGRLASQQVSGAGEAAFRLALALTDDGAIRNVFGILESRAPRATVTQEELAQVARVFRREGEVEYALRAYRALLNLRFLAEVGAGEGLINLGRPAQGLRLVHDLTRAYPDIPSVVDSVFNVPQVLLNLALTLPDTAEGRFQARRFRRTASRWLAEYLARYGTEERAAQAALIQLNTLVELEQWPRLVQLASAYMERYSRSEFIDSFIYLKAYGNQRLGNLDEAVTLYRRVVDELFGGGFSGDRDRARLAIAQIHHARGELEQARELYEEIQYLFPDAETALATLQLAELRVPAVVEGTPGRSLRLPIRVRDVETLQMWVYEVDLERLFLREKQVRAVEDISLAGIEPVLERDIELDVNHGTLAEHTLELDLEEPGAYLVLLRGPTVRASALAIITNLRLDIVEDTGARSLHVWVTDHRGRPQEGARIRVARPFAGSTDTEVTDLRGLARLPGYDRQAHVLAQVGESYAVYRGAEQDAYALPSQIITTTYAVTPCDFEDSLIEGQMMRATEIQTDNAAAYEQNVLRNRRADSNFELW